MSAFNKVLNEYLEYSQDRLHSCYVFVNCNRFSYIIPNINIGISVDASARVEGGKIHAWFETRVKLAEHSNHMTASVLQA